MSEKKTGIGWLAIGGDGTWGLVAYNDAHDNDSPSGDAAESASEWVQTEVYSLHKVTFQLPDPPKVQGKDVAATIGKAEEI